MFLSKRVGMSFHDFLYIFRDGKRRSNNVNIIFTSNPKTITFKINIRLYYKNNNICINKIT